MSTLLKAVNRKGGRSRHDSRKVSSCGTRKEEDPKYIIKGARSCLGQSISEKKDKCNFQYMCQSGDLELLSRNGEVEKIVWLYLVSKMISFVHL